MASTKKMSPGTFDELYDELSRQLRSSGNIKNISYEFSKLDNDRSRAAFTLNLPQVNDVFKVPAISGVKSNVDALKFKDMGNKQFQKGNDDEAVKLYTKSIAYAPVDNEASALAVSYANRSAALFHKGNFNAALLDIERALHNGYPNEMRYKLYERKGKCYRFLGDHNCAKYNFEEALTNLQSSNVSKKKLESLLKDINCQLDECSKDPVSTELKQMNIADSTSSTPEFTDNCHQIFESLSSACDVEFTEEQGRFIVATRDMKPGEIVLIEKPFSSVLLLEHSLSHCHHCFKPTVAPVPSNKSCSALFCGEDCRDDAQQYHKYEWPSLETISKSGVGKFGYLALRTIAKNGPSFLKKFKKELDDGLYSANAKRFEGCSRNGKYKADEFNAIYNLVTHSADRSVQDLFRRSVVAVFLTKCLETGTFFEELDGTNNKLDFQEFVASLILSHLQSFPCNAHEISELQMKKGDIVGSLPAEIGAGIYSTLSLFNHSCDPVANRNFYGDTCVVRTIKQIKKGEEISDNYGAVYAVHNMEERYEKLAPQYHFKCACKACLEDWPLYPDIENQHPTWKCPNCGFPLVTTKSAMSAECIKCNIKQDLQSQVKALEISTKKYESAFSDLLEGQVEKALPVFLEHLQVMDDLLCLPWRDFNNCQEAVKQCFSVVGNHVEM